MAVLARALAGFGLLEIYSLMCKELWRLRESRGVWLVVRVAAFEEVLAVRLLLRAVLDKVGCLLEISVHRKRVGIVLLIRWYHKWVPGQFGSLRGR